jgi:hypothetical protein
MTPREIAATLTDAQKRALLWLDKPAKSFPLPMVVQPLKNCAKHGLCEGGSHYWEWIIFPIGIEVRAILEEDNANKTD